MNTIKNVGTKVVRNKKTGEYVLLDSDVWWPLFVHKLPSVVRKAKHHWFMYLTADDLETSQKHLKLLESLNEQIQSDL